MMNGEDVVVGGRYVVGPEKNPSSWCDAIVEVIGSDSNGFLRIRDSVGITRWIGAEYLTPDVEPDAAGDESAHDALLKRAEKAEAERDEARATKDMHKERADDLEAALTKAEAEVRRLQDERQNDHEAWVALSDDYEELRAAPQLPADLPVVESVTDDGNGYWQVHFSALDGWTGITTADAKKYMAVGLAVLAAEAAKNMSGRTCQSSGRNHRGGGKETWCDV